MGVVEGYRRAVMESQPESGKSVE